MSHHKCSRPESKAFREPLSFHTTELIFELALMSVVARRFLAEVDLLEQSTARRRMFVAHRTLSAYALHRVEGTCWFQQRGCNFLTTW